MIKKIWELAFLFLLFGGSSTALAHHELANRNLSNGQKNYQSFCARAAKEPRVYPQSFN